MSSERPEIAPVDTVRVDKWLWAARIFKTRALAAAAVQGGKVHLNGARTKPAKPVRPGDTLTIQRGPDELTVQVLATSARRGPASVAATLYDETEESRTARATRAAARAVTSTPVPELGGRPTKRTRRAYDRLHR